MTKYRRTMDVLLRLIDEESLGPLLFDAERFAFRIDGEQAQIVAAPRDIEPTADPCRS